MTERPSDRLRNYRVTKSGFVALIFGIGDDRNAMVRREQHQRLGVALGLMADVESEREDEMLRPVTFYFIPWTGGRRTYDTVHEAFSEAFAECTEVCRGSTRPAISNLTIVIFRDNDEPVAQVTLNVQERQGDVRAWSPGSYPTGGDTLELSPEEYAMVIAHRLGGKRS